MKEIDPSVIIRHLERNENPAECRELYEWVNSCEENRKEYYRIVELWAIRNTRRYSSEMEVENAVRDFNSAADSRHTGRRLRRMLAFTSSVAAILAITLIIIGVSNLRQNFEWHTFASGPEDGVQQLYLKDGTKVYLNNSSEISFRNDFATDKRNVKLTGEAYFEVVSDPLNPFTVKTDGVNIKVLGTSFNVRTGEQTETVLEKGRVALEDAQGKVIAEMKPGQRAVYDLVSDEVSVEYANTAKYTSWRFDQTVYESILFIDIVRMIEERFGVSVSLSTDMLDSGRYRIVIGNDESLEQVMETLKYIAPIDYTIDDDHVKIKINKTSR